MKLSGSIAALITPFDTEGNVDLKAYARMIAWHIEQGTDGIVCCGSTGESTSLGEEELIKLFRTAVDTAQGRIPIIAYTGTSSTQKTVERTKVAKEIGVDAALVIVPYYNRPPQRGIIAHFEEISNVDLPYLIYHHPKRTGVDLEVETVKTLLALDSVIGFKDASGGVALIEQVFKEGISYFSGDDPLTLPLMERGAAGVISVLANVLPGLWKEMTTLALCNEFAKAKALYDRCKAFAEAVFLEVNPIGIKYAASLIDLCEPRWRLPLVEPLETTKESIRNSYESLLQGFKKIQ